MTDAPQPRWFHPKPVWLILGLLAVECVLWLSERFQWPMWHKGYAVFTAVAAVGVVFVVMLLWLIASLLFRWRFQFSIRSLLFAVVVVALPFSWLAVEMKAAREQKEAVDELRKVAKLVQYDWQLDASGRPLSKAQPAEPEWLRKLLTDDFFGAVARLWIAPPQTTDAGLARIAGLTQLRYLFLQYDPQITDAGLARIAGLTRLQDLWVDGAEITDKGLAHLAGLTRLQQLSLNKTQITDAGLPYLAGLTYLQYLALTKTQVTDEGVRKLQQALPNCRILH